MRLSRKGVEIYVIISEKVLRIGIRDRIDTGLKQYGEVYHLIEVVDLVWKGVSLCGENRGLCT